MSFPQRYEHDAIRGRLINGLHIVLVESVVEIWFPERAVIHSRAALIGTHPIPDDAPLLTDVEVQVEGLDAVSSEGPLKTFQLPTAVMNETRYLDWSYGAVGNPESTSTWEDAEAEVELRFHNSMSAPEPYFFRVAFSPVVLIRFTAPLAFVSVFTDWIEPLRRIVALSTGRQGKITYLAVGVAGGQPADEPKSGFQVYGTAIHQMPYSSRGDDVRKTKVAFRLSTTGLSLLGLLRRWQELDSHHHPLLESYGSMMFAPLQHPRSRFLVLIQAIEGLHGAENEAEWAGRVERHQKLRDEVLVEGSGVLCQKSIKFLKSFLMKQPISGLDERLKAVLESVPIDVRPQLEQTPVVRMVRDSCPKDPGLLGALRTIRNDLAHGNRGYDADDLHAIVRVLEGVVWAHLLRVLGCPVDAQKDVQGRL